MLFQDELVTNLKKYTIDTFPRSSIIEGPEGGGKHLVISYIKDIINIQDVVDITGKLTVEDIDNIYLEVSPKIYILNGDELSITNQNSILKFVEEPLKNAFVIVLTTNRYNLLATIRNRCICFKLHNYTSNELKVICPNLPDIYYNIFKTPGELKVGEHYDIQKWLDFGNYFLDNASKATFQNILSIDKKFSYSSDFSEKDTFPALYFLYLLNYLCTERIKENTCSEDIYSIYKEITNTLNNFRLPNINKNHLFQKLLIAIYRINHRS